MDELSDYQANNLGLHIEEPDEWALDVVCGMEVDPSSTQYTATYNGRTYYFCNKSCRTHFGDNPKQYTA